MKIPNPIEIAKIVGNASQAVAILQKVQKIDVRGVQGKGDIEELIDEAKQLPGDLDVLNKRAIRIFSLYEGLMGEVDKLIKEAEAKDKK